MQKVVQEKGKLEKARAGEKVPEAWYLFL